MRPVYEASEYLICTSPGIVAHLPHDVLEPVPHLHTGLGRVETRHTESQPLEWSLESVLINTWRTQINSAL